MGYLLTWNGDQDNFPDTELRALIRGTAGGKTKKGWWSAGSRVNPLPPKARVFLLKQGTEKGIFGSGHLVDGVIHHEDIHWASMIKVVFDTVLPLTDRLPRETLMAADDSAAWSRAQASCTVLKPQHEKLLEKLWARHLRQLSQSGQRQSHARPSRG